MIGKKRRDILQSIHKDAPQNIPQGIPRSIPQSVSSGVPPSVYWDIPQDILLALRIHPFFIPSFPVQGFKNNKAVIPVHLSKFETIFGYLNYCWRWTFYGR